MPWRPWPQLLRWEVSVEGDVDPKVGWVLRSRPESADAMKPLMKLLDHRPISMTSKAWEKPDD